MDDATKSGRTVLFVSHNMSAIEKLCSKCFLLNQGSLEFSGPSNIAISKYLNFGSNNNFKWERKSQVKTQAFFNSIKIYQKNKIDISTSGSLNIDFQYEIASKFENLNLHLALLDNYGQVIFSSAPEDFGINKSLCKGRYNASVTLPEDLLVPMNYCLKLILWNNLSGSFEIYDSNEEIKFRPIETNSLINNTPGGRSGIIALKCKWKITQ